MKPQKFLLINLLLLMSLSACNDTTPQSTQTQNSATPGTEAQNQEQLVDDKTKPRQGPQNHGKRKASLAIFAMKSNEGGFAISYIIRKIAKEEYQILLYQLGDEKYNTARRFNLTNKGSHFHSLIHNLFNNRIELKSSMTEADANSEPIVSVATLTSCQRDVEVINNPVILTEGAKDLFTEIKLQMIKIAKPEDICESIKSLDGKWTSESLSQTKNKLNQNFILSTLNSSYDSFTSYLSEVEVSDDGFFGVVKDKAVSIEIHFDRNQCTISIPLSPQKSEQYKIMTINSNGAQNMTLQKCLDNNCRTVSSKATTSYIWTRQI